MSAHREFTVKQTALPPAVSNLIQLLKDLIQLMEQNLKK